MQKNILFLVTGMTPQIITETVWALACDPENDEQWIPDEVHVMSTVHGLNQIRDKLLETGTFNKLLADYHLPAIRFDESCLHCIKGEDGQPLHDLRTPEENDLAADAICAKIRDFSGQDNVCLHVSIAGGRKTMGFYAGYALSLYGRPQDRMSHVLVDSKFETLPDFFYPTPITSFVKDRDGNSWDASTARVWLANISFVRMKDAIHEKHQLRSGQPFSKIVNGINESYNEVRLRMDLGNNSVVVNDVVLTGLNPAQFAMLYWFADKRKAGCGILAPKVKSTTKNASDSDKAHIGELTEDFRKYYADVKNVCPDFIVDKVFFESTKSRLNTRLKESLGMELASRIAIVQDKRGTPFYLNLPADAIEIIDPF